MSVQKLHTYLSIFKISSTKMLENIERENTLTKKKQWMFQQSCLHFNQFHLKLMNQTYDLLEHLDFYDYRILKSPDTYLSG